PPPPRRGRVEPVGREANATATAAFARAGFRDPTLILRWEEIAGAEVARLARPVKLSDGPSGGTLTLKSEPGASLFLQHETRALCERINAYLGRPAVSRLRFVQGALALRPIRPSRRKPAAAPPPHDPAVTFKGAKPLQEALLRLARQRTRDFLPD
ncbi:MAG TPA: DciA family protein, partial [Rhizomicrobium sp.]|nr:DciA family protein [Rhizomicrobium sp.]